MQIAEWGLARRALRWGRRVHGDAAEDLALLAWCEANSGGLERAQRLLDRLALRWPANAAGRDLLARLQSRFADFHRDPRRRPIEHPTLPLVLEPLHPDHAFALHRQYRDPQIAVMAGLDDLPTVDQARQWIEKRRGLGQHADFAVMHRHAGLVGCVGLRFRRPAAGLVYWIGAEHQGKGFGTAAAHLLCTWGLTQGLGWIFTSTYRDNLRSIMALERIGFRRLAGPRASDGQCVFMGWPAQDESATTQAFSGYLDAEDRESRD
jgi:RimJ/RimL family protein N-acetyltransferase